jgi:four helix bundle protein
MHHGYHKLIIWQKGKEFLKLLYKSTDSFPASETFGLQSQLRRAALSFLLNIVEGQRRTSKKEFFKFLNIAEASLVEVEACLEIAMELAYISLKEHEALEIKRRELAVMLQVFIKGLKKT